MVEFQAHLVNLQLVFDRLQESGLKLKPQKRVQRVNFLGHVVSADGMQTDPQKTELVSSWPTPASKWEVQQFLGLASYYRRFVRDFATIAKPLYQLTEKTTKFKWTSIAQEAFKGLRH